MRDVRASAGIGSERKEIWFFFVSEGSIKVMIKVMATGRLEQRSTKRSDGLSTGQLESTDLEGPRGDATRSRFPREGQGVGRGRGHRQQSQTNQTQSHCSNVQNKSRKMLFQGFIQSNVLQYPVMLKVALFPWKSVPTGEVPTHVMLVPVDPKVQVTAYWLEWMSITDSRARVQTPITRLQIPYATLSITVNTRSSILRHVM